MNKTQNYQLSLWDKTDRILMTDFNSDNAKLEAALSAHDAALTAKADQTAMDALQAVVTAKCEVVFGTYTGDGAANQTISLGFTPKAVYVCTRGGISGNAYGSYSSYGGLAFSGNTASVDGSGPTSVAVTANGFRVYYGTYQHANDNGMKYHYMAFR